MIPRGDEFGHGALPPRSAGAVVDAARLEPLGQCDQAQIARLHAGGFFAVETGCFRHALQSDFQTGALRGGVHRGAHLLARSGGLGLAVLQNEVLPGEFG